MLRIFTVLAASALFVFLLVWGLDRAALSLFRSSCQCDASSLSFSYFPPRLRAHDLSITFGDPLATEVRIKAGEVELPFSLLPLLRQKIRLGRVRVWEPEVAVTEGDKKNPGGESQAPDLKVEGVEIEKGEFVYKRNYPGRSAAVHVHGIRGLVGPFGSGEWARSVCSSQVEAVLEKSGKIDLRVEAAYFSPTPQVKVVLKIEDQNLKDLNSYFSPSDGIELLGRLHFGLGVVSLDGSVLRSTVTARYSDFNLTLNANKERSGLEAFFGNLLSGLKIDDGDLDEGRKGQAASVELRRKKEESVVSALLRGLREAVLKVATT